MPEWYRVSDETVQPSSLAEALRANPVLLFYERVRREEWGANGVPRGARGVVPRLVQSWSLAKANVSGAIEEPTTSEGNALHANGIVDTEDVKGKEKL